MDTSFLTFSPKIAKKGNTDKSRKKGTKLNLKTNFRIKNTRTSRALKDISVSPLNLLGNKTKKVATGGKENDCGVNDISIITLSSSDSFTENRIEKVVLETSSSESNDFLNDSEPLVLSRFATPQNRTKSCFKSPPYEQKLKELDLWLSKLQKRYNERTSPTQDSQFRQASIKTFISGNQDSCAEESSLQLEVHNQLNFDKINCKSRYRRKFKGSSSSEQFSLCLNNKNTAETERDNSCKFPQTNKFEEIQLWLNQIQTVNTQCNSNEDSNESPCNLSRHINNEVEKPKSFQDSAVQEKNTSEKLDNDIVVRRKKFNSRRLDISSSDESNLSEKQSSDIWKKPREKHHDISSTSSKSSVSNPSSNSSVNLQCTKNLLSDIYGNTWDKEKVLTPLIKSTPKSKKSVRKRPMSKDLTESTSVFQNQDNKSSKTLHVPNRTPKHKVLKNCSNTVITPLSVRFNEPSTSKDKPSPKLLSFLRSLSATPPSPECNVKALLFRKGFRTNKESLCQELFKLYNNTVFDNKLPSDMKIEWNVRMNRTAGYCYNRWMMGKNGKFRISRIELSTKVCTTADRTRDTLIHELCHAAAWVVDGVKNGHGPAWNAWVLKAMRRFPELPPIKRCHSYTIETKYTYKCKMCGYSIGRHSKSLDLQRKRCGYCYGEFELFVNTKSKKSGSTTTTQRAPRTPSGFALYVQENYKIIKEKRTDLKHSEIMKILGTQFSALKMDK